MRGRIMPVLGIISVLVLLVMVNFTTPTGVGPFGVLIFFLAMYVLLYEVAVVIVKMFRGVMKKKGAMGSKDYLYAGVIAFGPVILLLVQAFSSVNLLTVMLAGIFVGLGCFLVNKRM